MDTQPPIHSEIWKQIRQIEIKSSRMVDQLLSGQYMSVFKGIGLEFEEVRPYQEGDDERHIDWNVTARTDHIHIKRFVEERELSVFLVVDVSPSVFFGSRQRLKIDLAIELAAILAFSAMRNNDRVGLLSFDREVQQVIPPKKGRKHALRVIRELLMTLENPATDKPARSKSVSAQASTEASEQSDLTSALNYLNHILHRRGIVFILSDFLNTGSLFPLRVLSRRHDCIAVRLNDPLEQQLPNVGWVRLRDPETGKKGLWNLSSKRIRRRFEKQVEEREARLQSEFQRMGVDQIQLSTDSESVWKALLKFYQLHRR